MSLLRTSRQLSRVRTPFRPARVVLTTQRCASDTSKTQADGASGKSQNDAEPKILNRSPPHEGEAPKEVEEHNKEMSQRADRPAEKVTDEDVEKDKVGKKFWEGHGEVQKKP